MCASLIKNRKPDEMWFDVISQFSGIGKFSGFFNCPVNINSFVLDVHLTALNNI